MCASADLFTAFSSEVDAAVIDDAGVDLAGVSRSTRPAIWRYIVNSFVGRAKMRQDAEGSSNLGEDHAVAHDLDGARQECRSDALAVLQRRFGTACPR